MHPGKFGDYRYRGIVDITFLACSVISFDQRGT